MIYNFVIYERDEITEKDEAKEILSIHINAPNLKTALKQLPKYLKKYLN